ncbi:hypothetical protein AC26_1758 [Escherichia coli 1-176-05_S3_C2]|nr:hypothetical protein AC26_1758 [Escherichia coli 1-176-05_S3_C2]
MVIKYQKTLVQDRGNCMIEISFCEVSGIMDGVINGLNSVAIYS